MKLIWKGEGNFGGKKPRNFLEDEIFNYLVSKWNEGIVASSLGDRAKVKARFSNEERRDTLVRVFRGRKQSFQTKRDGKRYFRRFVLVSLQNLLFFFSLSPFFFLFFLSYEHTTRGCFTFEFNNDINFCSLFFFLSFLFFLFFLLFSLLFNPSRCKRGKKFRLQFPRPVFT